jgi:hypothetical protein
MIKGENMVKEVKGTMNAEPAEGQVPAGDYQPVPEESETSKSKTKKAGLSNNQVAKEVIAGQWGRGQRANERLRAAGYDVAAVREEIKNVFTGK